MTSRLAVLVYHRVAEDPIDPFGLCVPPAAFRSQMQTLVRSYRPVPLATRLDEIRNGPGAVAVSFDDGYLDNLEIASRRI